MKKTLCILMLCFSIISNHSAQAQSFDDLLKGFSNLIGSSEESAEQEKVTHPEIYELIGRWMYDGLVVDYTGDSALASVAISALEGQLPALASKFNLLVGRDYIEIGDDGTVEFVSGESRIAAHCTYYDSYDGEATLNFYIDSKSIDVTATIIVQGGKTKVLFNANKLMELLAQHYPKFNENTSLQMAKSVIDSYPGIRVGAAIKSQQ